MEQRITTVCVRHLVIAATSGVIISIVSFVLFQIFPRQILGLFGTGEPEYFEFGVRFFRIFLFFIWLDALQPITSTFFTSIGKPAKGIFLSLTRQIIFFIPLLLILPAFYGNRRMYLLWTDCRLFSSSCYNYHGIS